MKRILQFLTLSLFVLILNSGCKVSMVPIKNADVPGLLTRISDNNKNLYNTIINSTDKRYLANEANYIYLGSEIDSLNTIDKGRLNNKDILNQDKLLKKYFYSYQQIHQRDDNLTNDKAITFREYLNSFIAPRIISEKSLK